MRSIRGTLNKTAAWLRRFVRAKDGNTAIVFALASVALMSAGGAGVDVARAVSTKNRMADALDAAALAVGGTTGLSTDALTTMAQNYFTANYPATSIGTTNPVRVDVSGQTITLSVDGSVPTTLLQAAGLPNFHFTVTNQVLRAMSKLRVALVLDNTGSMSETDATGTSKMTALKNATHQLLTTLQGAAINPGDVEVAVIPFAREVNIGTANKAATWLDWTYWNAINGTCSRARYTTKSDCTSHGKVWTAANHNTWNGCVMDRDQDNDALNTTPTVADTHTLFPAPDTATTGADDACPTTILGLGHDWNVLSNKVDAMSPSGNTNQTIGLAWGWQALTQDLPMSAAALPADTTQVIILLTDGLNTQNRWSSTQATIDARTQLACNNVKAAHIQVYTVLVMAGNSGILQNCATDGTKYYALTTAGAIVTTFNTIGTQLANLHLTK